MKNIIEIEQFNEGFQLFLNDQPYLWLNPKEYNEHKVEKLQRCYDADIVRTKAKIEVKHLKLEYLFDWKDFEKVLCALREVSLEIRYFRAGIGEVYLTIKGSISNHENIRNFHDVLFDYRKQYHITKHLVDKGMPQRYWKGEWVLFYKYQRICSVPDCEKPFKFYGFCRFHGHQHFVKNNKKRCSIQDCALPMFAKSYCQKHYQRLIDNGNPLMTKKNQGEGNSFVERFWSKVSVTADAERCWEWQADRNSQGYGISYHIIEGKKTRSAHRIAYFLYHKISPNEMQVLHKCDNPPCVNPHHLFLGTQQDNVDDMIAKGRQRAVRGESNGNAKLTTSQVKKIRSSYIPKRGVIKSIAKDYGVTASTIGQIVRKTSWRHL